MKLVVEWGVRGIPANGRQGVKKTLSLITPIDIRSAEAEEFIIMAPATESAENRLDRRYEIKYSLVYFRFTSKNAPSHKATAYNCSENGLCFQSPVALKPGQCICIRKGPAVGDQIADDNAASLLKSFSLAEVRWCRKDASAKIAGYEIGVKYM